VATFTVDQSTGALKEVGRVSSRGDRPTYITIDKTGRWALVANNLGHLVGHSIAVFEIKPDGKLAEAKQFHMTGVRAHQIRIHPSNKYVFVPNIDSDTISQFLFDASTGKMTPNKTPTVSVETMSGPRHLDFHPNGKWLYLSNEYAATVMSFKVNDDGTLTRFHTVSGLPADYTGKKWQSEIRVTPNGRFVYAGERSHESIATFEINQQDGKLTFRGNEPTMGKTPRNFVLSPDGKWMIVGNQESNSLVTFGVDPNKGSLSMAFGPLEQSTPYVHMFLTLP
jgi:6-phosphogluconolactonase